MGHSAKNANNGQELPNYSVARLQRGIAGIHLDKFLDELTNVQLGGLMEKLDKRARSVNPELKRIDEQRKETDDLDHDAIFEEVKAHLDSDPDPDAKQALAKLTAAGCAERRVILQLYAFCGEDPRAIARVKSGFVEQREQILRLAAILLNASRRIDKVAEFLRGVSIDCYSFPDPIQLKILAEFLKRVGNSTFKELASRRRSGRDWQLVYLSRYIKIITGRQHYKELADLVNAIELAYGTKSAEFSDVEALRKRIERYGSLPMDVELSLREQEKSLKSPDKDQ